MRRDRVNSSFINKYQERKIDLSCIYSNVKEEESRFFVTYAWCFIPQIKYQRNVTE